MEEDTSDQALFDLEQLETSVLRLMASRNGLSPEGERDSLLRRIKQKFALEDSQSVSFPGSTPPGRAGPPPGRPGAPPALFTSTFETSENSDGEDYSKSGDRKRRRKPKLVRKRLTPQSRGVKDVPSPKKARSDKPDAGMISISSPPITVFEFRLIL